MHSPAAALAARPRSPQEELRARFRILLADDNRLHGQGGEVPIIAVTAFSLQEEVERCYAAGMNDFLAKPFQLSDLAAVLDRWLL